MKGRLVELLGEVLILHGWGQSAPLWPSEVIVVRSALRILAVLMARHESAPQLIGKSVQPVMAMVNLMKDASRFTAEMEVDRAEVAINGLKVLRLLTSEKESA